MRDTLRDRQGVDQVKELLRVGGRDDDAAGSARKALDPRVEKRVRVPVQDIHNAVGAAARIPAKDRLRGGVRPDSFGPGAGAADRPQRPPVERLRSDAERLRAVAVARNSSSAAGGSRASPTHQRVSIRGAGGGGAGGGQRPPVMRAKAPPHETTDMPPNGTVLPRNWDRTGSVSWTHAVVVEQHKLIFCAMTKCGSTQWRRMLRRLNGAERDYLKRDPHNPNSNGLTQLHKLPAAKVTEMVTDPSYTKAIFVRSPVTRVLSAYRDKIEVGGQ
jgi:hypothetical protein